MLTLAEVRLPRPWFGGMKQIVITGGGGGLGTAIAFVFAEAGWEVLAPDRTQLDVTDSVQICQYFEGHAPDLLVCTAGTLRDSLLARASENDWDTVMAVNYHGASECAQAVLPAMTERGHGHIIFISSFSALHPPMGQVAYAAAKAALLGLTKVLAHSHGPEGIRINAILPGFLETKMTQSLQENRVHEIRAAHALGTFNTVDTAANFIRFLHEQLPHTSGQVFQLDSRP
jgi:3-oxoacyl-[acyl-carrier protein] reductase